MRLLILNQYALPRQAPGITRHGDLGAALVARGHHVEVIASRFNYLTRREDRGQGRLASEHGGVVFRWLRTGSYRTNDRSRLRSMLAYLLLATLSAIRGRRPDIVMASSPHLFTGLAGWAAATWHRVPFVLEVRDFWPSILVDLGALKRGSATHRALEALERWLYRRARLVIFVPPQGARRLHELRVRDTPSVHVPNSAELDAPTRPLPESMQAVLSTFRGRCVFMYLGAHGPANDLTTLVAAFDELRIKHEDAYGRAALLFVGDGSQKAALSDRISASAHQNIRLHPPIPKPAVTEAIAAADVLLVSVAPAVAHSYGLSPNKLFHYMAGARPVLISSHGPAVVEDAGAGLRYEPGDASALADRMAQLIGAPAGELQTMGLRGRDLVERRYSLTAAADRLEEALVGLLAK